MLTNCTFDGIVYDVQRVMRGMPGDQAGPGLPVGRGVVRLRPVPPGLPAAHGHAGGPHAARAAAATRVPAAVFDAQAEELGAIDASDDEGCWIRRLMPDPARARVRVYATQSTHKTLTSLRQGSMIHVFDQDFGQKVEETFHEAYMAHTSTSPNYQILASLDLGRRQAALEGFELVQKQVEYAMRLRDAVDNHPLLRKYMRCLTTADLIPAEYRPSGIDQPLRSGLQNMHTAWEQRRVRPGPVPGHDLHRRHRHRRRHVQADPPDGPLRRADQQDLAQHRAVHDEHRHHPQLGGLPDRGAGQDRPRARGPAHRHEPGRAGRATSPRCCG